MKRVFKNVQGQRFVKDIGRNDICLCGSKMKFKDCCIDKAGVPLLRCIQPTNIKKRHRWMLKAIKKQWLSRINRATKRYVAKMARRNRVIVRDN